jgi:hypothetical protein
MGSFASWPGPAIFLQPTNLPKFHFVNFVY